MKRPENILPAIELLMKSKRRKGFPRWILPVDIMLTIGYLSLIAFIIYKVVILWLT